MVEGVSRDIIGIKELNFPVFSKGTAVASSGKTGVGDINIPISCGGASINPGDIIVGDADGVVVIPQSIEQEVLIKSLEKVKRDQVREDKISGNHEATLKYLDKLLSK